MNKSEWENRLNQWRQPLSETEEKRCANAERMVKEALKADTELAKRNIEIFLQGSYRNNTNVRTESDIDICVRLMDVFFTHLPPNSSNETFGLTDAVGPKYADYKQEVINALVAKFGEKNVEVGKKAVVVIENSYRIHADVVICYEHRRYRENGGYYSGVEFRSTLGDKIINFPLHHIENGTTKNVATGHQYKRIARILKTLNIEMDGVSGYKRLPSFFIECLAWNVPNETLINHSTYYDAVRASLQFLHANLTDESKYSEWGEVSELLYLFRGHSKWTAQDGVKFAESAWEYAEFTKND
ncbi:nucleotidyltransferase domain-containing protein [Hymenobacter yonginensis]|uniref:Nucleotidyltransferase n=1 Tax=Hymenobacter yonginensis TaxID=748197 RepID=A0ABY7PNB1_9BACT|nr:nucleotidyltransferase [Hymenobacter yonginensis]WBO84738.1 nucleotidyltransferase [Hymenobacter yonginensis]